MVNSWIRGLICTTRVGCSGLAGPMQRVCCIVLDQYCLIDYSTILQILNSLLNAGFANEPYIIPSFWYPCALAYFLCGLRSIPYTHLAIIIKPQLKKNDSEGEDLWLRS